MISFGWRTNNGESKKNQNMYRKKIPHAKGSYATLQWYRCGDPGLDRDLVLCYSVESTDIKEMTNLKFEDRQLQTLTSSGKKCTGRVSGWHSIAIPGTYNNDGTIKN